ncbi:hypothetical protein CYY_010036 [Polysphondylium violaceum]|uniref:FNIP repeat-containing protein n=1 Tax=Polysphondylium violaceum TaxID=133409 RepID=A0A8J4UVG6_9MYCE|nr:hypothetical protein CYY_010036 [Polysphondylium violaceum]
MDNNNHKLIINSKNVIWDRSNSPIEFDEDQIFSFNVKYDRSLEFQVPDGIKNVTIELNHYKRNITPPTIPETIKFLTLSLSVGFENIQKQYYDEIVEFVKRIHIPSTVCFLTIKIYGFSKNEDEMLFLRELVSVEQRVVKKSRKLNNNTKETTAAVDVSVIPSTVKTLSLPRVDQFILDSLPTTLENLITQYQMTDSELNVIWVARFNRSYASDVLINFPATLKCLALKQLYARGSHSLFNRQQDRFVEYRDENPHYAYRSISYTPGNKVPDTVVYLKLDEMGRTKCGTFPSMLKYLEVSLNYLFTYKGYIPKSVEYLKVTFDNLQHDNIPILVPSTLKYLDIPQSFEKNIQVVDEKDYYSHSTVTTDNTSLKSLVFPLEYNQDIAPHSLPVGIQELILSNYAVNTKTIIPPTVTKLTLNIAHYDEFRLPVEQYPTTLAYLGVNNFNASIDLAIVEETINNVFNKPTYASIEKKMKDYSGFIMINSLVVKHLDGIGQITIDKCVLFYKRFFRYPPPNIDRLDRMFDYKRVEKEFNQHHLETQGPVVAESLPLLDVTDLTLSYEHNKSILSKLIEQPQILQPIDDSNQRFNYSIPLSPNSDLFFFVFRNKYLKNIVLQKLINPSLDGDVIVLGKPVMGSTTILVNEPKTVWNFSVPGKATKIVVHSPILTSLSKTIPPKIAKLMDGKYHVHLKTKPIPSDTTHLIWPLNEAIQPGTLPNGLMSIVFNDSYNQPILANTIPNSVLSIRFGISFKVDLDLVCFPPNLHYLYLSMLYDKKISPSTLPNSLKLLEIGDTQSDDYSFLPPNCDHLSIIINPANRYKNIVYGANYSTRPLDFSSIPSHIKYLKVTFGPRKNFRQMISKLFIPKTLLSFTGQKDAFSGTFRVRRKDNINDNENENGNLIKKPTLSLLTPTTRINESINLHIVVEKNDIVKPNTLIDQIKSVHFGSNFNQTILPNTFPNSIESITFGYHFAQSFISNVFPVNLKKLVLGFSYNKPIDIFGSLLNLDELELGFSFQQELTNETLPRNLKKLVFVSGYYHKKLLDWIPPSVTDLTLGYKNSDEKKFILPLDQLPESITRLSLGDNQHIKSATLIPSFIKHLRLGPCLEYDGPLPPTLESLELGKAHNYPLHLILPIKNNYL